MAGEQLATAKAAVVTGANSGIGLETARGLARRGYRTVLLCRSKERAERAKADIDASVDGAQTEIVLCDLGLQSDVRRAASEIIERLPRLDVLVNNAGLIPRRRLETSEGVELMLAVNHLGPFLLTNLLLPLLQQSAPSRVVTVASGAHQIGKLRLDDLQATRGVGFLAFPRYGEVKLMNILMTRELARRVDGTGVVANCLHPGGVRSGLGSPPPGIKQLVSLFLVSAEKGASTSLAVATDPANATVNGSYFVKAKPADGKLSKAARDDEAARALWARSAELVGL